MNKYILIRRLRGPAFLLLVGIDALLAQAHILGWHQSWPFFLIIAGAFALAERAAIATNGVPPPPYPGAPFTGAPYAGAPYPGTPYPGPSAPQAPAADSTSIVPTHSHEFGNDPNGGQS